MSNQSIGMVLSRLAFPLTPTQCGALSDAARELVDV
jgi:hypothetical protein